MAVPNGVDSVYGTRNDERTNRCNGYRTRGLGHPRASAGRLARGGAGKQLSHGARRAAEGRP